MRRNKPSIVGARLSLHTGQQLVSCGNPALDHILGGGLPIGSILLIEEDKIGRYSKYLSRVFLSEGVVHKHALFLASLDSDPNETIKKLPPMIADAGDSKNVTTGKDFTNLDQSSDEMRIAWRYNNLNKVDSEQGGQQRKSAYSFDLTRAIEADSIASLDLTIFDNNRDSHPKMNSIFKNPKYISLIEKLKEKVAEETFDANVPNKDKNLLRICIESLASPLWYEENFVEDLCLFLTILKGIVRTTLSVCCLTMPTHLFKYIDSSLVHRVRDIVDYGIELESFAGSDKEANPIFNEYHGLFYIRKMFALNSLAAHTPESYDLAFKLRRKRFVIEKLHLPPELQESNQREQDDNAIASAMSCGSATKHLLEF